MAQVLPTQVNPPTAHPSLQAFANLLRAHAATTRALSAQLLAEHGLTINDYEALLLLANADERRMKRVDLARRLLLTPSGVTRLLEGLESAGLVERTACATDLRVAYAQLTDSGAAKLEAASHAHVGAIRALFGEHLSEREATRLAELLAKLPGVAEADDACSVA